MIKISFLILLPLLTILVAQVGNAHASATVLISPYSCGVLDRSGAPVNVPVPAGQTDMVSNHGNGKLSCNVPYEFGPGAKVTWNFGNTGLSCFGVAVGGYTDKWQEQITPDGTVNLACQFKV